MYNFFIWQDKKACMNVNLYAFGNFSAPDYMTVVAPTGDGQFKCKHQFVRFDQITDLSFQLPAAVCNQIGKHFEKLLYRNIILVRCIHHFKSS